MLKVKKVEIFYLTYKTITTAKDLRVTAPVMKTRKLTLKSRF